jgi:outer membrane usher protein
MGPAHRHGNRRWLLGVGALFAFAAAADVAFADAPTHQGTPAPSDAYPTFLTIRINSQVASEDALLLRAGKAGERFFIRASDAESFRFVLPADVVSVVFEGAKYIALNGIVGVELSFDEVSQTLSIDVAANLFQSATIALLSSPRRPTPTASLGSFFSYDLYAQRSSAGTRELTSGGQFDWGIFTPAGVLTNTFFGYRTDTRKQLTRLDTAFTIDDPSALASWRIGDTTTQAASWGNPALFAGVQYTTNFGTQPGFVTYPLNSLSGQTSLPSVVDVYVNNVLTATQRVQQGPFTLNNLPNINGRGEIRLVVRDLLGREQSIVQSLYGSTQLLRPGLNDFSLQAGTLRENYGLTSNAYGRGFASGVWRRGIDAKLTTEAGLELARGRRAAGLGATWLAGGFGELTASFAHSTQAATTGSPRISSLEAISVIEPLRSVAIESRSGHSRALRWDWRSSRLTLGGQMRATSPGFRTITNGGDFQRPRREMNVFAGLGSELGSFAIGFTNIQRDDTLGGAFSAQTKLAQLSWSKGLGQWGQLSLNAFTSLTGPTNHSITIGYFVPLGFTGSAGLSGTRSTSSGRSRTTSNASLQRNTPAGDGYGYRLLVTDDRDAILGVTAQNRVGVYALDVSRLGETATTRLGISGSLVYIGDELAAGRRAETAFALVSVPGFANVRVMLNNQEVGRTNELGNLFVPRLRPYETNQISIDQQDLPLNAEVTSLRMDVTPFLRSGLVVRFPVRESFSGIATFIDERGNAIPSGATLTINADTAAVPIAERGNAFLTGLKETNRIRVTFGGRSCTISIKYQRTEDPQPNLGVFTCKLLEN